MRDSRSHPVCVRQLRHPGPNNALLWASGLQFGFRRHRSSVSWGRRRGIGVLALAVAAGLGVVVTGFPEVELRAQARGIRVPALPRVSARRRRLPSSARRSSPSACGFHEAAAFQFAEPEGMARSHSPRSAPFWPDDLPVAIGSAIVILTTMVLVVDPDRGDLGRRRGRGAASARHKSTVAPRTRTARSGSCLRPEHRVHLGLSTLAAAATDCAGLEVS